MREFRNEWFIKQIMTFYHLTARCYDDKDYASKEELLTICSRATELTFEDIGFVMPLDMFFEWTSDGFLTDYDGHGYWLDAEGKRIGLVDFFTEEYPKNAVYVAWYNK